MGPTAVMTAMSSLRRREPDYDRTILRRGYCAEEEQAEILDPRLNLIWTWEEGERRKGSNVCSFGERSSKSRRNDRGWVSLSEGS